jgi:hypothetical protein
VGALLAAVLAAAQIDAAVATGGHFRSSAPGEVGASRLLDVEPKLAATLEDPGFSLQGRYAPLLWTGDTTSVRHDGSLSGWWQQTPNLRWSAQQSVRYGPNEAVWDPGLKRPFDTLEPLLPIVSDELSAAGGVGFGYVLSRTAALNAGVGYLVYGGASAASRKILPLQQGPQIYSGLDQELTRTDRLSTSLYASHSFVSDGTQSSLIELTEGWERTLDRSTRTTLSAGASVRHRSSDDLLAVATAALQHDVLERTQRVELRALIELKPYQSRLTGNVVERADVGTSVRWVLGNELWIRARAAAAKELGAARYLVGAVDGSWRLGANLSFAAGVEAFLQQLQGVDAGASTRWMAFTALTFTTHQPI